MTTQPTNTINEQLVDLIVNQVNCPRELVVPEADFTADLGFDSLDVAEFVINLEEAFRIEIPDDDVEQLKTVQQVLSKIEHFMKK